MVEEENEKLKTKNNQALPSLVLHFLVLFGKLRALPNVQECDATEDEEQFAAGYKIYDSP